MRMGTKERADECAFQCGRTSLLFLVSDLLEYLERADLDGTFAVNILHLQLSVFEPHRLLFNLNSLHGRGATNRRVGSPASIPPAEIAFCIFGVGFGKFTAAGWLLNSPKPQIKYIRHCHF